MKLKTFFICELLLGLFACTVPPKPDPDPQPEPDLMVRRDEFKEAQYFELGKNSGNTSGFSPNGLILTAVSGSGWAYSNSTYKLDSTNIEIQATSGNDFCLELSKTLYPTADNGFFTDTTRLRAYVYDPAHKLFLSYRKLGQSIIEQDLNIQVPAICKIRLHVQNDTLYFDYFNDTWKNAVLVKSDWSGSWYIALSSNSKGGKSEVRYIEISGPAKNFEVPKFGMVVVSWDKNKEKDLKQYKLEVTGHFIKATQDTSYTVPMLPIGETLQARVAAQDTANNWSEWSSPAFFVISPDSVLRLSKPNGIKISPYRRRQ